MLKPDAPPEDYTYLEADSLVDAKPPLLAKADPRGAKLSFKVLQFADLHYSGNASLKCQDPPNNFGLVNCTEPMLRFTNELLDFEAPDLVVFTGGNIAPSSGDYHIAAIDALTAAVEQRKIPFALALGVQDSTNGFPREQTMDLLMKKKQCYAKHRPTNIPGVGNYALDVLIPTEGAWGDKQSRVFRMYFLDSHAYRDEIQYPLSNSPYGWIQPSQIDYYRFMASTNTKKTPSVMFFHIPLLEYATTTVAVGQSSEPVHSASVNSHLFPALLDVGDVKATFVGQDRLNDYRAYREQIHLCYGGGAGFGSAYGNGDFARRARLIEWQTDDKYTTSITTWTRWYGDIANKKNERELFFYRDSSMYPIKEPEGSSTAYIWYGIGALGFILVAGLAICACRSRCSSPRKPKSRRAVFSSH